MLIDKNTSTEEISDSVNEIAKKFKKQEPKWIPSYTLSEMKNIYGFGEGESLDPSDITQFYYDKDSKKFFHSEEHFQKVAEYSHED